MSHADRLARAVRGSRQTRLPSESGQNRLAAFDLAPHEFEILPGFEVSCRLRSCSPSRTASVPSSVPSSCAAPAAGCQAQRFARPAGCVRALARGTVAIADGRGHAQDIEGDECGRGAEGKPHAREMPVDRERGIVNVERTVVLPKQGVGDHCACCKGTRRAARGVPPRRSPRGGQNRNHRVRCAAGVVERHSRQPCRG